MQMISTVLKRGSHKSVSVSNLSLGFASFKQHEKWKHNLTNMRMHTLQLISFTIRQLPEELFFKLSNFSTKNNYDCCI